MRDAVQQTGETAGPPDAADPAAAGAAETVRLPVLRAELPFADVIGIDPSIRDKPYFNRCELELVCGSRSARLVKHRRWNGADIWRWFWSVLGWSQYDPRSLVASGFHDDGCDDPRVPQVIADAEFVTLLRPLVFEQIDPATGELVSSQVLAGIGEWRARIGYCGVRLWSIAKLLGLVKQTKRLGAEGDA